MANQYKPFTDEQLTFLKNNADTMTPKELASHLNRCLASVYNLLKKHQLGKWRANGRKWSDEEVQYLKDNYLYKTYVDIAIKLNRTEESVQSQVYKLGLKKHQKNANWTNDEIDFLKSNIDKLSYKDISSHVKRTVISIRHKAHELGLVSNDFSSIKLKKEQVQFILANCNRITDKELAIRFNVSVEAISAVRKKNGIKKSGNEVSGISFPEKCVKEWLDEFGLPYLHNSKLGDYLPDFQLQPKIIIEVQGDYYHCNPYLYPDGPQDEVQIKHVLRDYYKKCYYLSNGYTIIYTWENDILKNPQEEKERIKHLISAVQDSNILDN